MLFEITYISQNQAQIIFLIVFCPIFYHIQHIRNLRNECHNDFNFEISRFFLKHCDQKLHKQILYED